MAKRPSVLDTLYLDGAPEASDPFAVPLGPVARRASGRKTLPKGKRDLGVKIKRGEQVNAPRIAPTDRALLAVDRVLPGSYSALRDVASFIPFVSPDDQNRYERTYDYLTGGPDAYASEEGRDLQSEDAATYAIESLFSGAGTSALGAGAKRLGRYVPQSVREGASNLAVRAKNYLTEARPLADADYVEGVFRDLPEEMGAFAVQPQGQRQITTTYRKPMALPAPPAKLQPEDYVKLIEEADTRLPQEAGRAITDFVGHEPGTYARGTGSGYGVMLPRGLEAAFGSTPDKEALSVREQLDAAFSPIRAQIGGKAGDTIKLYRYQRPVSEAGIDPQARNVLSWTAQPGVAREFAGVRREPFSLWDEDSIRQAEEDMAQSGEATIGHYTFVRNTDYPEYADFYKNGEYQTDTDAGLRAYLEDENAYFRRLNEEREIALQGVKEAYVPLDDVVWATNRAGQHEFIVRNRPGAPFAIDKKGVMGGSEFKRGGLAVKKKCRK